MRGRKGEEEKKMYVCIYVLGGSGIAGAPPSPIPSPSLGGPISSFLAARGLLEGLEDGGGEALARAKLATLPHSYLQCRSLPPLISTHASEDRFSLGDIE